MELDFSHKEDIFPKDEPEDIKMKGKSFFGFYIICF